MTNAFLKQNLEKINANYSSTMQKVGLNQNDPYALVGLIETNPNDEQVVSLLKKFLGDNFNKQEEKK